MTDSLTITRDEFLRKLDEYYDKLNSTEIQLKFVQETDINKKKNFKDERQKILVLRRQLQNEILGEISDRLKPLENDLNEGIKDLTQAINNVDNTVDILATINNITGIIARILAIPKPL